MTNFNESLMDFM